MMNQCRCQAAAELGFPLSQAELQKAVSEMDTDKRLGYPWSLGSDDQQGIKRKFPKHGDTADIP